MNKKLLRLVVEFPEGDPESWSYLAELVAEAVEDAGGELISINDEGSPDPFLFDNPDKLPEGIE